MKKLYTLAAAAMMCLGMNAQTLYVCGQGTGLAWTPEAPYEVALTDGAYTFEITELAQFKISTAFGDWDTFNAGAIGCIYTESDLGNPVALAPNANNIMCPWIGDYKIVVAGDLSTITMTTTTPKPIGFTAVYIRGTVNEWGAPAEWQMETSDGVTYWFDCTGATAIPTGAKFKIADAGWSAINYGAAGVVYPDDFGTEWMYNAGDGTMAVDYVGTIEAKLPSVLGDGSVLAVTIHESIVEHNAGVNDVTVDANAPKVYYNLQGVEVANPANGLYIVRQGDKVRKVLVK